MEHWGHAHQQRENGVGHVLANLGVRTNCSPFLAMMYAGALMYTDGPKDRSAYYKQMQITAPPTAG